MAAEPVRILVRIDATAETGLGHAVRTLSLLSSLPFAVKLEISGAGYALGGFFPEATLLPPAATSEDLWHLASRLRPDAVLMDLPSYPVSFWQHCRTAEIPVIVIDDWGGPIAADLIVNGTVLAAYHRYPAMSDSRRLLCGRQFIDIFSADIIFVADLSHRML